MPNPRWNNQHGANVKDTPSTDLKHGGPPSAGASPMKTANWPGLPGKTQSGARNAGTPKTGHKGPFHVKAEGI